MVQHQQSRRNQHVTRARKVRAAVVVAVSALLMSCQQANPETVGPATGTSTSSTSSSTSTPGPSASTTSPDTSASTSSTRSAPVEPIDTAGWTAYESTVYDLTISHPPDWTVEPADHAWNWKDDASEWPSSGHETFSSADGTVAVSVWTVPLEPGTSIESTADIETWLRDYCDRGATANCQQMAGPHLQLCVETHDCHPGLLVPFRNDVQAYFTGGNYPDNAMTIVAIWRGNRDLLAEPHRQAQRLLMAYLSTMDVWPDPTPES